jgi:hypothetical protein
MKSGRHGIGLAKKLKKAKRERTGERKRRQK